MQSRLVTVLSGTRIGPTLDLDFRSGVLDPRTTFTRASSGTFIDSAGLVQTASSNVARFTHDPVTLASLGLLIEEARTNLITHSEQINNAAWTHVGGSHTANQTTAPSGEVTADLFTENSAASTQHRLSQVPAVANGSTYTVSVFVKRASGSRHFGLIISTGAAVARIYFDLDTGSVATVVAGSGTITAYPNGWYRCTATGVSGGLFATTYLQLCNGTTLGSETYTGDGTSGLYIWGAQLEAGSFPTSYIPTTGATVQRAADVCDITGSNFTSWFNQSAGTVIVNYAPPPLPFDTSRFESVFRFNPSAERWGLINGGSTTSYSLQVYRGGVFIGGGSFVPQSPNMAYAVAWDASGHTQSYNGTTPTTSSLSPATNVNTGLSIGTSNLCGTIGRIRFFRRRLSDQLTQDLSR
jgi:hypothetical protein